MTKKGLTSGIEVLKQGKISYHSDIENLNKDSDERDQINKGDQLDKKVSNSEEGWIGSNKVLRLGIVVSQSFVDKAYDEID